MIAALVLLPLTFALLTAYCAGQRGHDFMLWYFIGLVIGPIGLAARLLPLREDASMAVR